jgi:hypothetical protein
MVISDFIGRLGNHLFQLSAAVGYATKYNVDYEIAPWEYSSCFNINAKPCVGDVKVNYGEKGWYYEDLPFIQDVKLFGFFQSYKYFEHCEAKIRELFQFSDTIKNKINSKYTLQGNTCAIHVRRGDYLGNFFHEICHLEYYQDAIAEIKSRENIDLFVVFSDDINWCKKNLTGENYLFIEDNSNIEDLYLMTQCTHNIIANSSFSWWGAWLNANVNKIVISPNKWFGDVSRGVEDLLPKKWIQIKIK